LVAETSWAKGWAAPERKILNGDSHFSAASSGPQPSAGQILLLGLLGEIFMIGQQDHGGAFAQEANDGIVADRIQGGYMFGVAFELSGSRCSACRGIEHTLFFAAGDRASDCDSLARPPNRPARALRYREQPKTRERRQVVSGARDERLGAILGARPESTFARVLLK